jgi:hypothetical protein
MKPGFIIVLAALLIWSCSTVKEATKTSATLTQSSQDSTEYEVYIDDPHFDLWYQLNYSEAKDRTNDYYRNKDIIAVENWNDYYRKGKYIEIIDSYINYQLQMDYGIEVNRKLYWYFKFVSENYKVRLFW